MYVNKHHAGLLTRIQLMNLDLPANGKRYYYCKPHGKTLQQYQRPWVTGVTIDGLVALAN